MPIIQENPTYLEGEDGNLEPIALCGMACRLPGAVDSASSLWEMLVNKRSGQTPKVPASRFNIDAHYHQNLERPGSFNVLGGYFLDQDLESFDPTFFNMTPVEAMWLDPQQRKMLEVCYEALENAGLSLDSVAGSNTAVFVGCFTADYQQMSTKDPDFRHAYAATGVDPGIISNRIGNVFNLKGPSFTINTACSSSVYATHMACHALRQRDCDAAIVGGVNLILTVDQHMNTAKLGILSPTSTCHTFDASADGYGRAEGAGALYMKRLSDALRDGDPVRGVIRSSAVNTNGKVNGMGITHPSVKGQERVVRQAYERARLNPNNTAYLECHGTGTPVGDPIEVRAVSNAMNDTRGKDKPLLLGAIKANIGHSEAASGIFAIMKAAMMTEAGVIPGVCGFKRLNPAILEDEWNVKIQSDTVPWPSGFKFKRASVSSFGYGGTNGHVIVEEATALCPYYAHGKAKAEAVYNHSTPRALLVGFSAHDRITLSRNIEAHAKVASKFFLSDLAHTLNTKRTLFTQRAFTIAKECNITESFALESFKFGASRKTKPELGFIFTGQGAQWARMGAKAIEEFPIFRETIRSLDGVLRESPHPPAWSLEQELSASGLESRLSKAEFAQPALTAIQIAIVDLFASWSINPIVTVGHSSGEMGAAYAAGLISAPEAMLAAYYRGFALTHHAPAIGGTMLAVGLGPTEALEKIPGLGSDPEIACENSPVSTTLSGTIEAISRTKALLDEQKIFARELQTGQAYHSSHMKPVSIPFVSYVERAYENLHPDDFEWRQPLARMVSSVTATEITESDISAQYWAANLTGRVRFSEAVAYLGEMSGLEGLSAMVEIGPHPALAGPFKQICKAHNFDQFTHIPSLVRNADCDISVLKTAGELFLQNYPVDLEQVNAVEQVIANGIGIRKSLQPYTLVDLPPYQWNYETTYWTEPRFSHEQRQLTHPRHDILGSTVVGLSDRSLVWRNILRNRDIPWLKDHSLGGSAIFPAAGHLSLAIEAVRQICENRGTECGGVTLRDVEIKTALVIPETDDGIEIQTRVIQISKEASTAQWYSFAVESLSSSGVWSVHCEGTISPHVVSSGVEPTRDLSHPVDHHLLTQNVPSKRWYDAFHRVGFEYGPSFQKLVSIKSNNKLHSAAANVHVVAESGLMAGESRYIIHPSTVDACLQLIIISIHAGLHKTMPWGVVPIAIEEASLYFPETVDTQGSAVAWTDERDGRYFNTHTKLQDSNNNLLLDVKGLRCVAYEAAVPQNTQGEITRKPYAGVIWQPDVSTLSAQQAIQAFPEIASEQDTISATVDLLNFRTPLSTVVVVDSSVDKTEESLFEVVSSKVPNALRIDGSAIATFESEPCDLVIISKEVFQESKVDSVLQSARERLSANGKVLFSVDGCNRSVVEEAVKAAGLVPATLLFSLPDVTVVLSGLDPGALDETATERRKLTLISSDVTASEITGIADSLSRSRDVEIKSWKDFDENVDLNVIIVDSDGKILEDMDTETFDGVTKILCSGAAIVWLTSGVNQGVNVSGGLVQGFLRTVRAEQSRVKVTLLDIDDDTSADVLAAAALAKLQSASTLDSGSDTEFWLHKGIIHINRILANDDLNAYFNADQQPAFEAVLQSGHNLCGQIIDKELIFTQTKPSSWDSYDVELQVDCFLMEGKAQQASPLAPRLIAGHITKANGISAHVVGQDVLTFSTEAFSTSFRTQLKQCVSVARDGLNEVVASLPDICRSIQAIGLSHLHEERYVVLAGVSSALSEALIKLAGALGFKFSTVSSGAEFRALVSEASSTSTPVTAIVDDFSGLGRDIWRYMPAGGRFFVSESTVSEAPDPLPFARGALFNASGLASLYKQNAQLLTALLEKSLELVRKHPELLVKGFQNVDIGKALEIQGSRHIVSYQPNQSSIKIRPPKKELQLSSSDVYLLVGCLGGLGRSLTTFMLEKGAKNFAFVSRSGVDKPEAAQLVASLAGAGANVQVFRADASDNAEIAKVVAEVSAQHRIGGVVHAAMVLKDAMFGSTMNLEMFKAALAPKIQGAQALHLALQGHHPDFFIMTSSVSGTIGNPGQSNYSAANTYLDMLAYHRNLNGLSAISLTLPMILDVGVVAESDTLESKITRKGWYGIDEREMLHGFETAMLQPAPAYTTRRVSVRDAQIVLGVEPQYFAAAVARCGDTSDLYWLNDARFSHIRHDIEGFAKGGSEKGASGDFLGLVQQAQKTGDKDAVIKLIADHLIKKCSSILMVPPERFEFDAGTVASYGLDSMVGTEFRNWLFKEFGLDISFQVLFASTIKALAIIVDNSLPEF